MGCGEGFNKTCSTGGGHGKPLQHYCLENSMKSLKREKDMTLKDEPPSLVDVQYVTVEEQRNKLQKK